MKTILITLLFLVSFDAVYADRLLVLRSDKSYVAQKSYHGTGDAITVNQKASEMFNDIKISEANNPDDHWWFRISAKGVMITPGIYNSARFFDPQNPDTEIEFDFSTFGRGAESIGLVKVHQAYYSANRLFSRFAADILLFENGNQEQWTYIEIRLNSDVSSHMKDGVIENPPTRQELEKHFKKE